MIYPRKLTRDAELYLKKLIGRKDVEDALQRLDRLTQEEARMAAAEALEITRVIDDRVKAVDEKVEGVGERVQGVDIKVEAIDNRVQIMDSKVQSVEDKVGSVIQSEIYLHRPTPVLSVLSLYSVRCNGDQSSTSTSSQSSHRPKPFVIFYHHNRRSRNLDLSCRE